jgi:hypothetical protein
MRITSVLSHSTQAILEGALIATLVVGLMAGTALAGKPAAGGGKHGGGGSGGGSGTIALVMRVDANGNGSPNWGDQVTFNVTSTASQPYVLLTCYQGGALVYQNSVGYFPTFPWVQYFVLSSNYWTSGAATCTAQLQAWNGSGMGTIKTLNITVAG